MTDLGEYQGNNYRNVIRMMAFTRNCVSFFFLFYYRNISTKAWTLTTSQPNASEGLNFSLTCSTSYSNVLFKKDNTNVCLIGVHKNNTSCQLDNSCNTNYLYACNVSNNAYTVFIPAKYVPALHQSTWTCQDFVLKNGTSDRAHIFVNVPVISVSMSTLPTDQNLVTVVENTTYEFKCKTNAVRPPGRIQWFLSGTNITKLAVRQPDTCNTDCSDDKVISSSILIYTGNRDDNGRFLHCSAFNTQTMTPISSNKKQLIVPYGPTYIELLPPNITYYVTEGSTVGPIACKSSCNPDCTFEWTGTRVHVLKNEIVITNISRTQTGQFICTSSNSIGRFEKQIDIIVQYPPKIKSMAFSDEVTISENSNVSLSCTADGEPAPKITWYLTNSSGYDSILKTNDFGKSDVNIYDIRCEDTGFLTCEADNEIYSSVINRTRLNVTCAPRQKVPCLNESFDNTSITTCWISNPVPEIIWQCITDICNDDDMIINSSLYRNTAYSYTHVLTVRPVNSSDLSYKVYARNTYGTSETTYYKTVFLVYENQTKLMLYKMEDDTKHIYIIMSAFVGGGIIGIGTSFLVARCQGLQRKSTRRKEYSEFQSSDPVEIQSYDNMDESCCGQGLSKNVTAVNSSSSVHTYEDCQI